MEFNVRLLEGPVERDAALQVEAPVEERAAFGEDLVFPERLSQPSVRLRTIAKRSTAGMDAFTLPAREQPRPRRPSPGSFLGRLAWAERARRCATLPGAAPPDWPACNRNGAA